jgi:hypothetical protein
MGLKSPAPRTDAHGAVAGPAAFEPLGSALLLPRSRPRKADPTSLPAVGTTVDTRMSGTRPSPTSPEAQRSAVVRVIPVW